MNTIAVKNDLSKKYGKGTIVIHWVSALLIFGLIPSGLIMANTEASETKAFLLRGHVVIGMIVFILTLIRSYLFFKSPRPPHLETGNKLHNKLVYWIENSFYIILILLPITGLAGIISAGWVEIVRTGNYELFQLNQEVRPLVAHENLAKILIALLIAHIGGVALHYIKFKENTLKRIS